MIPTTTSPGHPPVFDPLLGASEPDRTWTMANVNEGTPEILTPLCWSLWCRAADHGSFGAFADFGFIRYAESDPAEDPNRLITACFYGRQVLNLDLFREMMAFIPGTSADDFERDMLGMVRPDAKPVRDSYRRLPIIAVKMPHVLATHRRAVLRLHAEYTRWWRSRVLAGRGDPRALLAESDRRFRRAMRLHCRTRMLVQLGQASVRKAAAAAGLEELTIELFAGYGGLHDTVVAEDIWRVSRGALPIEGFVAEHGYYGPNVGNPVGSSWRENPEWPASMARGLAERPDDEHPRIRERSAIARREQAERQVLDRTAAWKRPATRLTFAVAGDYFRLLELGKSSFLMAIDGARAAARDLGADLVARGLTGEVDDPFFLRLDELLAEWPEDSAQRVGARRARRAEFERVTIPTVFTGMPEPVREAGPEDAGDVVTGVPASPGYVEGTARVVHDPIGADPLEPGEILVCRMTDPGWAPLFMTAEGLVIDIGGPASHGAIIARELAIPSVIGTGTGTTRLRTGDVVGLDGTRGVVTILRRADGRPDQPVTMP